MASRPPRYPATMPSEKNGPEEEDMGEGEITLEKRIGRHDQRLNTVAALLKDEGARSVANLGCGIRRLGRVGKGGLYRETFGSPSQIAAFKR